MEQVNGVREAKAIPKFIMDVFGNGPEVRLAGLGEDAVPLGCLIAAKNFAAEQ